MNLKKKQNKREQNGKTKSNILTPKKSRSKKKGKKRKVKKEKQKRKKWVEKTKANKKQKKRKQKQKQRTNWKSNGKILGILGLLQFPAALAG